MLEEEFVMPPDWGEDFNPSRVVWIGRIQLRRECLYCHREYTLSDQGCFEDNLVGFSRVKMPLLTERADRIIGILIIACPTCQHCYWMHLYAQDDGGDPFGYWRERENWPRDENGRPL